MKRRVTSVILALFIILAALNHTGLTAEAASGYSIKVNYTENVVTIYLNDVPIRACLCSTGTWTPHSGTYRMSTKYRWGLLKGNVWGQYCTIITGNIWFHSVPYLSQDPSDLEYWEYDKLGTSCSAGCVRLCVEDVKWIYDNVPSGTPVTFYSSSDPGPLGKPQGLKISEAPEGYRGWDPTDPNSSNPWNGDSSYLGYAFDSKQYEKYNPDLKSAYGGDERKLKVHWLTTGISEKRRASDEFDLNFYRSFYPELVSKYGNDQYALVAYYNNTGRKAGQIGSVDNASIKYIFDAKYYADNNPSLKSQYGYDAEKLWNQYIETGVNSGKQGSLIFSMSYYKNAYPDLKKAFGDNSILYLKHFVEHGMREGRVASSNFDVNSYKMQYPDLRQNFGSDMTKYYIHYVKHGYQEKRAGTGCEEVVKATTVYNGVDYSKVYDYYYYINKYPDVRKYFSKDDTATIKHFVEHGMSEGRQAISTFDVKAYSRNYADLRGHFGNDWKKYFIHYMNHGYNEKRSGVAAEVTNPVTIYKGVDYSAVYDFNYYITKYPDMYKYYAKNDVGALKHFVEHGMAEGRQGSASFSAQSYRNKYSDLNGHFGNDWKKYYIHYMNHGKGEGRVGALNKIDKPVTVYNGVDYSKVYDFNYYINMYPDMKKYYAGNDVAALRHFVNHGMSEGRQAKAAFNPKAYRTNYADLNGHFGNDWRKYYIHYMNHGYFEGRKGN